MKNINCLSVLLIFFGLMLFQPSESQTPDWTRILQVNTYGTQNFDCVTADANYSYMAASISGPATFYSTDFVSLGFRDMVIAKINSIGVCSWTKQINAQTNGTIYAEAIKVDGTGNIYIAGLFSGQSTIGGSTITSGTLSNAFIAKFDPDGNGLWATQYFYIGTGISKMAIDGTGNIYLISKSRKLLKFNNSGEMQWEQSYPDRTLQAIAVYGQDLFVGGALQSGTTNFGSIALTSLGGYNTGFLVKADLNGVYSSSMVVGGSVTGDGSVISDIILDHNGNLIMAGGYTKDLVLGTINITNSAQSNYTFITKCDNNFSFLWARSSGSISLRATNMWRYSMFMDESNNIYEYGPISSSFTYGSVQVNANNGPFLVKFDPDGNATVSFYMQNYSLYKIYVTPNGKILKGGSVNYMEAGTFGSFFISQFSNDLSLEWQMFSSNSQTGDAKIKYIKHDAQGNTYIQAQVWGYCNYFGHTVNSNGTLTIISKHDISGNMLWMNSISDISPQVFGSQFILDKDNNVLTAGLFRTSLNIGNTTLTTSNSGYEGYVAKYSSGGVFLWAAKMDLGTDVSNFISIASDNSGNVLVSGPVTPANYLIKFNASGNKLWAKVFPMESYYLSLISTDANDNIYLTSEIHLSSGSGSATIGSVVLSQSNSDGATALIKFTPDGNALWARTYGGVIGASYSDGWPCDIKTDASGNSYLWGSCINNAIFGTTTLINPFAPNQNYSYYLAKINTSGDVVWAKAVYETKLGFNYGDLLDLDKNGNVYVGGHFKDRIKIEGTEYTPEGTNDFFIAKFSNEGSHRWIKTIPANSDIISAISTNDENIISAAGLAGINSVLGSFPIERKGGSASIVATLGTLHLNNHFVPVWYPGNGMDHMNLYALTATLDGTALQPGDEIGVYDGGVCVGSGVLKTVLTGSNYLDIKVSRDDPDTPVKDGYTPGNAVTFKIWDSSAGIEVGNAQAVYVSGEGIFAIGATSTFNLSASTSETQSVSLTSGWNIFSFAVEPANMSMRTIVDPLIIAGTLVKVQDEGGKSIERLPDPIGWINDIGQMAVTEGYKIKVTENTNQDFNGKPVTLPLDISLTAGWNIIGYPVMNSQSSSGIFGQLIADGSLLKVQDEQGNAIEQLPAPIGWIDNIINLVPGKGYKVKTSIDTKITIGSSSKGESPIAKAMIAQPTHFKPNYKGNGLDHMNIYIKGPKNGGIGLNPGDEIGVFDGGTCVGAAVFVELNQEILQVIVSLDDPTTQEKDGFTEGNSFELRLWDTQAGVERKSGTMEINKGYNKIFNRLGTSVLGVDFEAVPSTFLEDAYPNPSTEKTIFTFQLARESNLRLEIFNLMGDLVKVLVDQEMPEGSHVIEWDNQTGSGSKAKAGIYFYRLRVDVFSQTKQLVIK
jgi:hypothetical protein